MGESRLVEEKSLFLVSVPFQRGGPEGAAEKEGAGGTPTSLLQQCRQSEVVPSPLQEGDELVAQLEQAANRRGIARIHCLNVERNGLKHTIISLLSQETEYEWNTVWSTTFIVELLTNLHGMSLACVTPLDGLE